MSEQDLAYEPDVKRVFTSREETRQFYNKIAGIYDLMAEHSEGPMREKGLAMLAVQPGETVLEVGFGTGNCLLELANAVGTTGKVLGIDLSDNMLAHANKICGEAGVGGRVALQRGDGEQLPYADASIDAIFTSFTLELFDTPDLPKVLAEWRRVLRPGGRLGVVAVSREGGPSTIIKVYEWTHKHFPNMLDCRPIYVARALQAAGFTVSKSLVEKMWVPVEIVLGVKPAGG
ncbi:MAG: class I SAM-dependent methyltransferase [Pirellulales bacterium]